MSQATPSLAQVTGDTCDAKLLGDKRKEMVKKMNDFMFTVLESAKRTRNSIGDKKQRQQ